MTVTQQVILKFEDEWMQYRDSERYDRRWQERCKDCLAPCCLVSMNGYPYNYDADFDKFEGKQEFYSYEFVIMMYEDLEDGFTDDLDPDNASSLRVCPLNVAGRCLIYEDRPSICSDWRCVMATSKHIGGGES